MILLLVTTLRFDILLIFSPAFFAILMNKIIPDMLLLAYATHSVSKAFQQFQTYLKPLFTRNSPWITTC